jgi:putative endonuclease
MMATRQQKGKQGEDLAAEHLKARGLRLEAKNVRFPLGEIDLVMRDRETVVFVEVKSRFGKSRGLAQEAVTPAKQRRLTRLAQWYLKQNGLERKPARFDVVAVNRSDADGTPELTWIVNAFEACE